MALEYKQPPKLSEPFKQGQKVSVRDRNLKIIGHQIVISCLKGHVRTNCGRKWNIENGYWMNGRKSYPFPSIQPEKETNNGKRS